MFGRGAVRVLEGCPDQDLGLSGDQAASPCDVALSVSGQRK
eukprot:CAMPEP_0117660452 /NCGR_PEP_ID=MMETSP0804-20121206/6976_1 /TAXON_ID=1074897 /ORGANISM="Tetraselmis astigmatica, Strain CCMP880" /LENGTH=40 /DNA_ID= /DNA_START= /DNA_END= /DNA_ORIENTATION=